MGKDSVGTAGGTFSNGATVSLGQVMLSGVIVEADASPIGGGEWRFYAPTSIRPTAGKIGRFNESRTF
jgi:flagellar hook protein FlgE